MSEEFDQLETSNSQVAEPGTVETNGLPATAHAAMLKEIRSWGLWSLGLGALHVISSGFLSAPWGVLLIIVGLASFYFRTASMFILYAVTLTWAGLSNLAAMQGGWIFFGLVQFYFAYRVFQQYRRFRDIEGEYIQSTSMEVNSDVVKKDRAARFFPWLGSLLSCSSILGLVIFFVAIIVIMAQTQDPASVPNYFNFVGGLVENVGVLGFAISLAALLSKYRPKAAAIVGLVFGALTLLAELAIYFL